MDVLASLEPKQKLLVMDLVEKAGHDVSAWSDYAKGEQYAASNPKFCYEWAFEQPPKAPVVNLWHAHMSRDGAAIVMRANMRPKDTRNKKGGSHTLWRMRARRLDMALRNAYKGNSAVRVIINAGTMRIPNDPTSKASSVKLRELDPVPWHVARYDDASGDLLLVRGAPSGKYVDQFSAPINPERRPTGPGSHFVRNPSIRQRVLERARGLCEFCNAPGFARLDGTVYLETHHIVPLEEGGPDTTLNVAAVCPNHHREAHSGARHDYLRQVLLERAAEREAAFTSRAGPPRAFSPTL